MITQCELIRKVLQQILNVLCCFVFLAIVSGSSAQARQEQIPTLAIIGAEDFSPDIIDTKVVGLPDGLAARIAERLTNSRRFSVLERKAMRNVIGEQRYGKKRSGSDIDRLLDEAIDDLDDVSAGTLAVAGVLASNNDVLNDFKDLGEMTGADFLVYAKLESITAEHTITAVPYSDRKKTFTNNEVSARLYLRVIEVKQGRVIGAASLICKVSEQVFSNSKGKLDDLSIFDELGQQAAAKIIDITAPAQIVSMIPPILNRGTNDGVQVGDVYTVTREGKEIKGSNGVVLGRVKTEVGKIKLTQVQDTMAVVEVLNGKIAVNDLASRVAEQQQNTAVSKHVKVGLIQHSTTLERQLPRIAVGIMACGSTANNTGIHITVATDAIISHLTKTKRFVVIDRQSVDQLLDEQTAQALKENRQLPSALGTLSGADYLIYGSLQSFCITTKSARLPGSSRTFTSQIGEIEGDVRIVDVCSGEIVASCKVSLREKVARAGSEEKTIALLADAYAEQVVLNLMSTIYPIKIAAIGSDGAIYINRGADGGLSVGETLTAYRQGDAVIDPDTGVQLGNMESLLGEVVVSVVDEARAIGKSAAMLQVGDLLKQHKINKRGRADTVVGTKPVHSGADLRNGQPDGKAILAIGNIELSNRGNNSLLHGDMLNRVTTDLYAKLSKSRRFELMERQNIDQLLDEQLFAAIAQGTNLDTEHTQLEGADYLIMGTVDDFYLQSTQKKIAALGEVQRIESGIAEASLRIVDVHNGTIVAVEKVHIDTKLKSRQNKLQRVNALIDKLSTKMVNGIVTRLYPIKVLGLAVDGTIFINRGQESGLRPGNKFKVMRAGEKLIDPDTGVNFGTAEMQVAIIKLTSIDDGRSQAVKISGSEIKKGDTVSLIPSTKHGRAAKRVQRVNKPSF